MGPEVLLFAAGFYLGWFVFALLALLLIPRRTRKFAMAVFALAAVGATFGVLSTNWGVPWFVSFPLVFAVVAIPGSAIACGVALAMAVSATGVRDDAA
jgi:hypothetical protein